MFFSKSFFSSLWVRIVWLIFITVSIVAVINLFKVESSLLKLLPQYQSKQTNDLITKATERVNKQVVLMASADDKIILINNFKKSLQEIEIKDYIGTLNYQVKLSQLNDVYQLLAPHKKQLISADDQQALKHQLGADYFVQQAQQYLYGVQQFNIQQLSSDPLFLWQRLVESMAQLNTMTFDTNESYFLVNKENRHHMFAFVELSGSAFSPEIQQAVVQDIEAMKTSLAAEQVDLLAFGAIRYAQQAFQDAKQEISTVGLGSLIGIVLLVVVIFRSIQPLLLCVACIALGLMTALAVTLLIFEQIHAFALVFGATIAGVSIDYCFHYLVVAAFNHAHQSTVTKQSTADEILPGLLMGFFSSALVYLGFLITGYAVLAQIAVFSVMGLLAVLINVLVFFPGVYRAKGFGQPEKLLRITQKMLNNPLQKFFQKPVLPLILLVSVVSSGLILIQPNDDIRALQQLSPTLKQEEAQIREVLSWPSSDYFVLITAADINTMLQQEAEVLNVLRNQQQNVLGISDFIPSLNQQQHQYQLQQDLLNSEQVQAYLSQFEIPSEPAEPFKPLDVEVLNDEAIKLMFKQRWLGEVNGQQALVIPLDRFVELPSDSPAIMIQQAKDTSDLFAQFRVKSTWMLGLAVLGLWLILGLFRYGFLISAHLISLPLLAGFMALLLTWSMGLHVSLFSILALLLILGMGLDYVIFLKESKCPEQVMLALIMSSLTTILAFGLLAFSQVAVLQSFGFMVGTGIAFVLFMSPAVTIYQNTLESDEKSINH